MTKTPMIITIASISDDLKRCHINVGAFDNCHDILAKVVARINEVSSALEFPALYPDIDHRVLIKECADLISLVMTLGIKMDIDFEGEFDPEMCARQLSTLAYERMRVWAAML